MSRTIPLLIMLIAGQAYSQDGDVTRGSEVYDYWCVPCHGAGAGYFGPDSQLPGTAALDALYKGARPAVLTDRTDLTPEFVEAIVRNGVSIMPFFRKTEISDEDLAAISAYLTKK